MADESFEVPPPPAGSPLVAAWRRVMTDPEGFFAEMPTAGGLNEPLLFLAACATVNAVGHLLVGWGIRGLIGSFIGLIAGAFLLATVLTLVAQHLFRGRAGFEPTFRVVAYALAPAVFFWIPRLSVVAGLWSLYLQLRGVEQVHALDAVPAVLSVLIGAVVTFVVVTGLAGHGPLG